MKFWKRGSHKERGQSLVEAALSFPILLLILSGLLDIGRVYYTYIAIEEAAAEAALYLAINPMCPTSRDPDSSEAGNPCADPNNAIFRAESSGNQEVDWNIAQIDYFRPEQWGIGDVVRITITYPFEFITPGIQRIADSVTNGNGLSLMVTATHISMFKK